MKMIDIFKKLKMFPQILLSSQQNNRSCINAVSDIKINIDSIVLTLLLNSFISCLACQELEYSVRTTISKYMFAALIENCTKVCDMYLWQLAIVLRDVIKGNQYPSSEKLWLWLH